MSDRASNQITELKVSGHTMLLEPGLYCVFNAPDGPVAAADSGLPGVRVTAAPGPVQGQVTVSGFNADGWIGADSGVLVRVDGAASHVLVTVYQAQNTTAEAPKLQVLRLSAETAAPASAQPAQAAPQRPVAATQDASAVEVVAHIYARGDVGGRLGEWMGEPGSTRWIEGFGVAPSAGIPATDIEYQAVLGRGWLSPWSEGGQFCGSRGMSLPILGLRVRLRGESAERYRVALSASFVDGTRVGPVGDGEACEAPSLAALEAFQLSFEPQAVSAAPAAPQPAPRAAAKPRAKAAAEPVATAVAKPARKAAAKPAAKASPPPAPAPTPAPARSKPAPAKPPATKRGAKPAARRR